MNIILNKLMHGMISLALLANISVAQPVIVSAESDLGALYEAEIRETSFVATSPLNEGVKRMTVDITAYSSTPDQTDDTPFITASGAHVRDGIVAANFLPLHTKVKIPELFGEKVFEVEDRMNRRYTHRMDIWMADRASARKFGLKHAEIVVLP